MTKVTSLADFRAEKERASRPILTITRSPELCLILAMLDAMPAKARTKAMSAVMAMSNRTPDDESGRAAAHLAASVILAKGVS